MLDMNGAETLYHIVIALFVILYLSYSGWVWRLRGGAWQNIGVHIGTNATRALTGVLLAGPVALIAMSPALFGLLIAAITVGLMAAGWGNYMGMGNHVRVNPMQWSDWPARLLHLKPESVLWDCMGMTITVLPMFTFIALSFGIMHGTPMLALVAVTGAVLFTSVYWAISRIALTQLPTLLGTPGNGIIAGQAHEPWSEFGAGIVVGLTLLVLVAIM